MKRQYDGMVQPPVHADVPQFGAQDFGFQSPSRLEAIAQRADEKEADCNHAAIMF
jgi:hypothetical protein